MLLVLPAVFLVFAFAGCKKDPATADNICTDPAAINYNQNAACIFDSSDIRYGCLDPDALNHNVVANIDNGSCLYPSTAGFLTVDLKALFNDRPFVLKDSIYTNLLDYHFKLETIKFYLSNLYVIKDDGTEIMVKDVEYINFENNHRTPAAEGEKVTAAVPLGDYKGFGFSVGVDPAINKSDPAIYPNNHPLSTFTDAHWNWNTGYIFLKIEGRMDTLPAGNNSLTHLFLYHCGTDPLYRELSFMEDFSVTANSSFRSNLALHVDKLFYSDTDTLNAIDESFSHTIGTLDLAEKVTNLFVNAIEKRP